MSTQEFNHLVLSYAGGLKPFAISLTKNQELAKDLYQETLCKALAYREKYAADTNIKAWLFTIMRNIFINEYRRNNKKIEVMEVVKISQAPYGLAPESHLRLKEINEAIYHLPANFKKACQLYFYGYKYQEIAIALNEPLGTVKSRIHFAKKILQNQLEK